MNLPAAPTFNCGRDILSVGLCQRNPDTFGVDIRLMRESKLTFAEVIGSDDEGFGKLRGFTFMARRRLDMVRKDLFEQLEQTPFA